MSEALRNQLGGRLRELREARGLTQAQLAHLLGKSLETISNFERGKTLPSLVTLEQLAGILGVSMQEFFSDQPVDPNLGAMDRLMAEAARLSQRDYEILIDLAKAMARR
jgi:transcriptional regulator with XRE-family HTH domain